MNVIRVLTLFWRARGRGLSLPLFYLPSSKSVKGSHGGVLAAARSSLQLGAMVVNVEHNKIEWRGHDWVACVVKAVRASYVYLTSYKTSTADARCPEIVSELRQVSSLKQRREFIIAADWNMVREQLETTGFLRLVGGCVIEVPGERGTYYSGRSINYLVVGKNEALRRERPGGQKCSVVGARCNRVRCDA